MPRPDLTKLLADNWHSLPHEDGHPRRLMHFSQFGQDADTKARVALLANDLGECVQTLMERNGFQVTHKDDPKPADAEGYKQVKVKCVVCGKQLFELGCDDSLTASLGSLAVKNLSALVHECAPGAR